MPENRDQADVLRKKGNVTQGKLGLQIWGEEGVPDLEQKGTGSQGTAERSARIQRSQRVREG